MISTLKLTGRERVRFDLMYISLSAFTLKHYSNLTKTGKLIN
jgi:hypothetical protein